ncbi:MULTISPECIES: ATP-binding cassette domain-containing protein [Halomonadaceae]|jgi:putative thiamine transport system ATP-binding protein|uniref:ATP-binding cassette domain-containing protein n=1 Tax=Vreelandella janggokensis TaxID=370767 RepID=A0ABT4IT49_9GAMM|nr:MULTISPECIES: ATP-binding cassette domain-containing protein [Halomonas]MCW4150124.1 ATP-binding cassette domain-containing protein [Halomonas sp. 18H]MCZ0926209.1 ATP-binding cassette domain-containing protein [Halomonas janggokensis]MCZ0931276.1 ATP-binding cassette domain-containing protein [Halomonas janggokensis]MDR5887691.1 ATP-binding cassette domain-containing protein [Halomonas janggokensis]
MTLNPTLHIQQVQITLNGERLLAIDRTIAPGEVLTVMGPSGSGKSTLLAYLAGFISPAFKAQGQIFLADTRLDTLPAEKRGLGLLFQDPLLFPHLSVGGNLHFGIPQHTANKQPKVAQALHQVGLAGYEERDPATLSGGQQARVALMRLLLSQPHAVLLDEPFSKLDMALRQEMRSLVFRQLRDAGLPALLVTHDHADADAAGGPIIELG